MNLRQIVRPHQPNETIGRAARYQFFKGIGSIPRAKLGLDIADVNSGNGGRDGASGIHAFLKRGHAVGRFERILRRHQPPHFIQPQHLERHARDMQVPLMSRIERAPEQTNAVESLRQNPLLRRVFSSQSLWHFTPDHIGQRSHYLFRFTRDAVCSTVDFF